MEYANIIFKSEAELATITFNRPKALNALNRALLAELADALKQIHQNEKERVLILTGSGEKAFVAGADITELAELNPLQAKQFSQEGQAVIDMLGALPIPVIAAVNGFALGGGTEMALACDFIYAAKSAMFGQPEVNLGLIPGFGGTQRLPRLVGPNLAKELIFTGKMITADSAYEMGLVNKVCADDTLMAETVETARMMMKKGRASLRAAKEAINKGLNVDLASGLGLEADAFALCVAGEDAKEGTTAFLEKRKASFKGTLIR